MYQLLIGNKNYSSWSLRAWLALRASGIAFSEQRYELGSKAFVRDVGRANPVGLVPVLLDDGFVVWDTLAICEYVAERHPEAGVWPADARARARARSLAATMHSGFPALRQAMPMNIEADLAGKGWSDAVAADVDRILSLWGATREQFGAGGPFLFGAFCAADAFFAPVVSRFVTYGVPVGEPHRAYMDAVLALPAMQEWMHDARQEKRFVAIDEPYRRSR
ncbi:glutathione S-transferase family protein [Verticiella sediminum]|uniref:Glutathione S-transferase family protein n=1 Tax=Verticiella sediminum TaxID=1247510 RepID=A0A556AFB6_9BURK|nr:glutathione S-transferase family protein [Verticiella sediminum]TSH91581.1 glutathione S-transferase family protein [Verticiella sediminum]